MEVIGDQCCIISLAYSGDHQVSKRNPKLGLLCCGKLLFTENFVQVRGVNSTLFKTTLVFDRTHHLATPVHGLTVLEPMFQIEKQMTDCIALEEVLDEEFSQNNIEC